MAWISSFGGVAGGLGLLIVGLHLATEGFKVAGGGWMARMLRHRTGDRMGAFATGSSLALVIPSGGAMTTALSGFVSSGLIPLPRALWALAGWSFSALIMAALVLGTEYVPDLQALALSIIAAGMALRWRGQGSLRGSVGQTILGIGVLLVGIHALGATFPALAPTQFFDMLELGSPARTGLSVAIGLVLSVVLRSTGASAALVVVGSASGAIPFSAGGALIVGVYLGVAVAAAVTLARGAATAKPVAAGNAILHLCMAGVGMFVFILIAPAQASLPAPLADPAVMIVLLQALMATTGTLLLWRADTSLARFVHRQARSGSDADEGTPPNLDAALLAFPELALDGLGREVSGLWEVMQKFCRTVLVGERLTSFRVQRDEEFMSRTRRAVDEHAASLGRLPLSPHLAGSLNAHVTSYRACCRIFDALSELAQQPLDRNGTMDAQLRNRILQLQLAVLHVVESSGPSEAPGGGFEPGELRGLLATIHAHGDGLEQRFFDQCARKKMLIPEARMLSRRIRQLESIVTHAADQALNAASEASAAQAAPKADPPSRVNPTALEAVTPPLPSEPEASEETRAPADPVAPLPAPDAAAEPSPS